MPDKPKTDTLSRRQLALDYGWDLAVLKSDPELYRLFQKTIAHDWTQAKFNAELLNTQWYQTHSATTRAAILGKGTDPATYKARLNQTRASVKDAAVAMGAQLTDEQLNKISTNVLNFGWNESQIRDTLAGAVKAGAEGTYGGTAAANAEQLRQVAQLNGVQVSDSTLRNWLVRIAAGEQTSGFEQYIRQMATEAYPQYADRLKAGEDLDDIISPYRETMARVLELNPKELDLFDPTLRKAFQAVDDKGQPTTKPLWQFESELKHDSRWQTTNNARDELMGAGQKVLRDFGLVS